jgi:hypothetical protein
MMNAREFMTVILLCLCLAAPARAQDQSPASVNDSTASKEITATSARVMEKITPFYAGVKVGALFAFGVEMNCIFRHGEVKVAYLAAAAQTSLLLNTLNAGGGVIFGRTGIGLGCRYHHLLWFEKEGNERVQPAVGPEIVWKKGLGSSGRIMANLHAGMVFSKTSLFPDVTIGLMLPLR